MKLRMVVLAVCGLFSVVAWSTATAGAVAEAWRGGGFSGPQSVSVNPTDGSCWVADYGNNQVVHLGNDGSELWRGGSFNGPQSVSVNATDGSCWVVDQGNNEVVHLKEDGSELWRGGGFSEPWSISANSSDGSCWVADTFNGQVVHLKEDGSELWRGDGFSYPWSVSVDPVVGGSCWVADTLTDLATDQVVHLQEDGSELWRGGAFSFPESVSVNSSDGSCWVADTFNDQVVHLQEDGTELWQGGGFSAPESVAVDSDSGACWVGDTGNNQAVWLAEDGTELWRGDGFNQPLSVAVNPTDGSCWVADTGNNQVVHLVVPPVAGFSGDPLTGPAPLEVAFSDQSTGGPAEWAWQFGDGGSSGEQNPSHVYALAGSYTVTLTVTNAADSDTLAKTDYVTVTLPPAPVANFTASPTSGAPPLPVTFTDASTNAPTAWSWDFGDGSAPVTTQNPTRTYGSAGSYTVSLTAANAGGSTTETKSNYITVTTTSPPAPVADFSATPTSGNAPLMVTFTDASTNTPTAWSWDFGDGSAPVTTQNPTHTYGSAGSYTVSLTATNAGGSNAAAKPGYITVTLAPPVADFTATPLAGALGVITAGGGSGTVVGLLVSFTDTSTGGPTSWAWSFGDGGASTDQSPTHIYQQAGHHTVSLTASNAGGSDTETKTNCITVRFTDVAADSWAYAQVMACIDAGIVAGYPGGAYQPDAPVTRDQMAVYIARAIAGGDEGVEVPTGVATPSFGDVPADHWAYRYVEYCAHLGIVVGYWDGTYHPDEVVNRGQMTVYIARADAGSDEAVPDDTDGAAFTDVTEDNDWAWCYRYVEYCAANDIVQGYWDGTYHPEREVTRDQMAVYMARSFELPM